jgi:hypothetical protein
MPDSRNLIGGSLTNLREDLNTILKFILGMSNSSLKNRLVIVNPPHALNLTLKFFFHFLIISPFFIHINEENPFSLLSA